MNSFSQKTLLTLGLAVIAAAIVFAAAPRILFLAAAQQSDQSKSAGSLPDENGSQKQSAGAADKDVAVSDNRSENSLNAGEPPPKKDSAPPAPSAVEKKESPVNNPAAVKNNKNKVNANAAPSLLNQLPDDPQTSVFSYENNLGRPRGQVEMDSPNRAAALDIEHRAGIADFSFGVPLASLPARGMDAGASLTYNSRAWNDYCLDYGIGDECAQHSFTYDVEQSWIAPGFSTGFGYLETAVQSHSWRVGNSGPWYYATEIVPTGIVDPDGTRHQVFCTYGNSYYTDYRCTAYQTTDGSYISVGPSGLTSPSTSNSPNTAGYASTTFSVAFPGGLGITYGGAFGSGNARKHYPVTLQDRNGNLEHISYKSDQSGRIDYIRDTLDRNIKFYYENDGGGNPDKLVAVTIPGMTANSEIQTVRFYYDTLTFDANSTGFDTSSTVDRPASTRILKYVYFPATKTGFRYDYHAKYGMIKKIRRLAGMTVSTTGTTTTGSVTSDGAAAATTEYDYPDGSTGLTEVPKYTKRTDGWQDLTGTRTSETIYNAPEPAESDPTRVSTITVKNAGKTASGYFDVEYQTVSDNSAGWTNGLIKETTVKKSGETVPLSKTVYTWAQGTTTLGRRNPVLQKIEVTNDAGLTKATEYEYDGYGNQTKIKEYDYTTTGSGNLLRTTEMTYETDQNWINNTLVGLVKSVKVTVGGAVVSKTLYEYDHNGSDDYLTVYDDLPLTSHNPAYNPHSPTGHCIDTCDEDPPEGYVKQPDPINRDGYAPGGYCPIYCEPGIYQSRTKYRGNLTQVTSMIDAAAATVTATNANVTNYEYDMTGNNVSATLSCCNLKTVSYGTSFSQTGYAYPLSQTKGGSSATQLTESATYNYNTGLVLTSTDENSQATSYEYETDTLRPHKMTFPNGGYNLTEYSDKLETGANLLPGYVRSTTTLDASRTAVGYTYFDGRGAGFRSATQTPDGWSISAVDYDSLGRVSKSYNPFYAATTLAAVPANTPFSQPVAIDALGRTTEVSLQDNTTVKTAFSAAGDLPSGFNKTFVTVTDQAGKQRRQVMDALGRIVRVDEPKVDETSSDKLGPVSSPRQPTAYEYDGNDNLIKTTQTDGTTMQERLFKYDSLSRLVAEKQVEANATLNDAGTKVSSGGLWTKVLKYDTRGHITDAYDANGAHTQFAYDGLNRVKNVYYSDGTPTVSYTYDTARTGFYNKGALTRVETAAGGTARPNTPATATEFDYDAMGRAVKQRQMIDTQTYSLEYAYNLAGQMTSEKYPSGRTIQMGYDQNGRLASVYEQAGVYAIGFQYQGKGNSLSSYNLGNGTTESFTLNDRMQITSQSLTKGSDVKQKYDYTYGQLDSNSVLKNNGKLAQVESYIGTNKQATKKYAYDELGRLKQEEEYRGDTNALVYRQNFDFDNFGNLYKKSANNSTSGQANPIGFTPIEASDISKSTNRLTSNTTYDDAGNVTQDTKFRNLNYGYDANGRMISLSSTVNSSINSNAVYDAAGQRVAEKVNGSWKYQVYDINSNLVAEYTDTTPASTTNISYTFTDSQGSTRATTDKVGGIQSRTDYQAYGEEISAGTGQRTSAQGFNSNLGIDQKYGQTERDEATGLDHTWFRKHENKAGRWTSPDPYNGSASIGDPQSLNKYSYTQNQPTNFTDPSGLLIFIPHYEYNCIVIKDDGDGSTGIEKQCDWVFVGWDPVNIGNGPPTPGENNRGDDRIFLYGGHYNPDRVKNVKNYKGNDCDELEKNIYEILDLVKLRFSEYLSHADGLYNQAVTEVQTRLRKQIRAFENNSDCNTSDSRMQDAKDYSTKEIPNFQYQIPKIPPIFLAPPKNMPVGVPMPELIPSTILPPIYIPPDFPCGYYGLVCDIQG